MLPLLIATSLAFQPAPRLGSHRAAVALPAVHHQPRTTEPQAVLPVAAKYALLAAFFAGPTVQLGYAIEVSAGIENGPFYRFVKSDTVQKGGGKIRRIEDVPKVNVRGARLPAEAQAVAGTFRKEYSAKQLEQVYGALLRCYGNEERALAAIRTNPQILNPSYSFTGTMVESKRVLLTVMSEEEALEVMRLNPAVLQCGPSLDVLGAGEIKAIAQFRNIGNTLFPPAIRTPILGALCATILLLVIAQRPGADPALLEAVSGLRPFVGAGVASIFAFVLYGVSTTGRKVDQMEKRSM